MKTNCFTVEIFLLWNIFWHERQRYDILTENDDMLSEKKVRPKKKNPRWLPHCDIITCKWGVFLFFNKEHWVFVNVFLIDSEPISLTISLALNKKCPIKKRRSWAGSSRISIIWSRRNNFCFMSHAEKINSSRDIALFESSIWLWEEALDSSSLRVNVN